ncbi:MAG TPA: hypothetical protein VFY40_17635 [Blastocatellia bacterium]|nr:hypothetical protein [Blastocatellia bacterium]
MLQDFIDTGKLGPIYLGISKRELQSILGPAEATSDERKGLEIWKFHDLQVALYQDAVYFIGVYVTNDSIKLPPPLKFDDQALAQIMRLEGLKKFLMAEDLEFNIDDKLTFDDQACLRIMGVMGAKIHLIFGDEKLRTIQVTEHSG